MTMPLFKTSYRERYTRPSIRAWWDFSDARFIAQDAGVVSMVVDKSAQGRHMVQASGASQPTAGVRTLGGLNVVDFDGSEFMTATDVEFTIEGTQHFIGVSIIDVVTNAFSGLLAFDDESAGNDDWELYAKTIDQFDGRMLLRQSGTSNNLAGGPFAGPVIVGVTHEVATQQSKVYMDGIERMSNPNYNQGVYSNNNTITIAANRDNHNVPLDCGWAELIALDDLTLDTRQLVEGYLAHRWGITANLDAGHPWKALAPAWTPDS